jgi:hypothetical protein
MRKTKKNPPTRQFFADAKNCRVGGKGFIFSLDTEI